MGKKLKFPLIHSQHITTDEKILMSLQKAYEEMTIIYNYCTQNDIDTDLLKQSIDRLDETIFWYMEFSG